MCVNISSIKRIFSNQSHYFPDIPCSATAICVHIGDHPSPQSRVLLEKLTVAKLVNKPAVCRELGGILSCQDGRHSFPSQFSRYAFENPSTLRSTKLLPTLVMIELSRLMLKRACSCCVSILLLDFFSPCLSLSLSVSKFACGFVY